MQRVKRSTAVALLPAAPAGGTPGYFAQPNPQGGVPATQPGYEWFNGVQEELMSVIEGQGFSGSDTDHTKLRQAITKMIQAGQRAVIISNATFAGGVTGTGKAVYWDSANSRFDLALANGSVKQNVVGFADVANANVYAFGDAVLFAGLTAGSRYYLDGATAGSITVTAPANPVFVGIAKGATELFIDVDAAAGISSAQVQNQTYTAFTTAGSSGIFILTPSPALGAYAANQRFRVKFHAVGNGSDTINVSGLGAKNVKQYSNTGAKVAPVIVANQLADIEYDGAEFVILDPLPSPTLKAWCCWNGTLTGTITPKANFNVASVTKNGTGDYTLNITSGVLSDPNYALAGACPDYTSNAKVGLYSTDNAGTGIVKTATAVRVRSAYGSNGYDCTDTSVIISGN